MLGLCPISALPIPDELTHMHEYVSHSTFISAHFWRYSRKSGLDLTFVKVLLPTGVFFNTTYTFIFMTLTRSPGTQSSFSNWCTFWFRMLSSWCWSLPSPSQRVLTIPRQRDKPWPFTSLPPPSRLRSTGIECLNLIKTMTHVWLHGCARSLQWCRDWKKQCNIPKDNIPTTHSHTTHSPCTDNSPRNKPPTRTVRQTTTTSPCYGLYEVGVASLFFEV